MKIVALFALLALGACSATEVAATNAKVNADLPTAQQLLTAVINVYQIDLGLAQVAAVANPALAPAVATITAASGPIIAAAQLALASATADAPTLEALATQIQAQANTLAATAAPAVKVVGK
jgi:hypothetical protein